MKAWQQFKASNNNINGNDIINEEQYQSIQLDAIQAALRLAAEECAKVQDIYLDVGSQMTAAKCNQAILSLQTNPDLLKEVEKV